MKLSIILLTSLAVVTTGCSPAPSGSSPTINVEAKKSEIQNPAIKIRVSPHDFSETVSRVDMAIGKRPLNLFAKIDHAAGAKKAGLTLPPSTLFIFGNPKGGAPLMQRNPEMGIVLPLKIHVFQDTETVKVSYTDIEREAVLHGLDVSKQPIPNIIKMLDGLTAEVTAP